MGARGQVRAAHLLLPVQHCSSRPGRRASGTGRAAPAEPGVGGPAGV